MFLRDHAPSVLDELARGLALVTATVSCEYLDELFAFDQIVVRMTLAALGQSRVTMNFAYWRGETLVARGSQQIACMRRENGVITPATLPADLREALETYVE
jgi:enediyne biosynthesis thioesterase